jgi:hypothetical protein
MKNFRKNYKGFLALTNQRGEISIKQIAFTLAVIIVIGAVATTLTGNHTFIVTAIENTWEWLFEQVKEVFN